MPVVAQVVHLAARQPGNSNRLSLGLADTPAGSLVEAGSLAAEGNREDSPEGSLVAASGRALDRASEPCKDVQASGTDTESRSSLQRRWLD